MTIKSILAIVAILVAASFSLLLTTTNIKLISALDSSNSNNKTATTISAIKVQAGVGNSTAPLTVFVPQNIQIKAGESITWNNPSTVGEPHTVTFVLDNKTSTKIVSPFAASPKSAEFISLPPGSNS